MTNTQNMLYITSQSVGYNLITSIIVLCLFSARTQLLFVLLLHFSPSGPDPFTTGLRDGYPIMTTVLATPLLLFEILRVRDASRQLI